MPGHDDTERHNLHVSICRDSWEAWDAYCRKHGVTITALLDAIGHQLAAGGRPSSGIDMAREIDADRRRR